MLIPLARSRRPRRCGATVVEAAMVLSMCLVFIFGVYEYGRFVMVQNLLDNAAREGARYACVHTSDLATSDIQTRVTSAMGGQNSHLQNLTIDVYQADGNGANTGSWNAAQFGQTIAVEINADYQPTLPSLLFMNATMHFKTKSVMCSEG